MEESGGFEGGEVSGEEGERGVQGVEGVAGVGEEGGGEGGRYVVSQGQILDLGGIFRHWECNAGKNLRRIFQFNLEVVSIIVF